MLFDGLVQGLADQDERAYLSDPVDVSAVALPAGCAGATDIYIVFHGAGGPDRETDDLLARVSEQDDQADFDRVVCLFDWRPWFSTSRRNFNSFHGQEVGRKLGKLVAAAAPGLRSLHVTAATLPKTTG